MIDQANRIRSYFAQQKGVLALVTVSGLVYNVGFAACPWLEGQLAQCLVDILGGTQAFQAMVTLALVYVAVTLVVQAMRAVKRFYVRRFANNVNRQMKEVLYANLVRMSRPQMAHEDAGTLMTKAVSDVDACVEGMRKFTTEVFDTGVVMVSYFCLLAYYDWRLALLSCAFPPIAFAIAERMKRVVHRSTAAFKQSAERLNAATLDRVEGAVTYRVFGCEPARDQAYQQHLADYERTAVRANIWVAAMQPLYQIIALLGMVPVIWLGARNVLGVGWVSWDIAAFTAFVACFARLAFKISKTAKLFNAVHQAQVSWKRIKPLLNKVGQKEGAAASLDCAASALPEDESDFFGKAESCGGTSQPFGEATPARTIEGNSEDSGARASSLFDSHGSFEEASMSKNLRMVGSTDVGERAEASGLKPRDGVLTLSHVDFAYPQAPAVLHDVGFSVAVGQVVGVTGTVASGKSTLGKLLLAEYPYQGSVTYGGVELADMSAAQRSALVGYLGHDPELLSDTIRNNVLLGSDAPLEPLLQAACLADEVAGMEAGADTLIGNGGMRLSGGQQARVALARTLAHPRPVMVLDDPFSAVDKATEALLFAQVRAVAAGSAVLLISHRLWLFPQFDQVIWLQDGYAAVGTHQQLMRQVPAYARLYKAQVAAAEPAGGDAQGAPESLSGKGGANHER